MRIPILFDGTKDYWSGGDGTGRNRLGELLMRVRQEVREVQP